MKKVTVKVQVRVAWWFKHYAAGVAFFCALFGCEPDMNKVRRWGERAIKCKVKL